jgi:hypothetical protein
VLMCFFLPFAEIKCNNVAYLKLSGQEMLRGKKITEADVAALVKQSGHEKELSEFGDLNQKPDDIPANPWAIAAFVMCAIGVIAGVVFRRFGSLIHLVASLSSVIALIGLQVSLNRFWESNSNSLFKIEMRINYLEGYWLSLILSGLTAGICCAAIILNWKNSSFKIVLTENNSSDAPPPIDTPSE